MKTKKQEGDVWARLMNDARAASRRAYAPYSGLRVGAALLGPRGEVYVGCNVENASLGLTICAERAALCRGVAEGARRFQGLAIYTPDAGPLSPCGACRQALAEFCGHLPIMSAGSGGKRREFELADLLPDVFGDWQEKGSKGRK